jgi:hypothetical protein
VTDTRSTATAAYGSRHAVAMAVATAVDGVNGARRTVGAGIEVATQYGGGRVVGVRLRDDRIETHIVVEGQNVIGVVDNVHVSVRHALDGLGDRRSVAVVVDDVDLGAPPVGGRTWSS